MRLRIAPSADPTVDPISYVWTDITGDLALSFPIGLKFGGEDEESESSTEFTFSLRNNEGRYTTDNPESDLYPYFDVGTPIEWAVNIADGSGWHVLCVVYLAATVDEWPAMTPYRCVTSVTAAGIFRRLGQGAALLSTMRRALAQTASPVAYYWPLEDGDGATVATPAVGNAPLTLAENGALDLGGGTPPAGAAAAPALTNGIETLVTGVNPTEWAIEFGVLFHPDMPDELANIARIDCGAFGRLNIVGPDSVFVEGLGVYFVPADAGPSGFVISAYVSAAALIASGWHHLCLTFRQDGPDVEVFIFLNYVQIATGSFLTATLAGPQKIEINHNENVVTSIVHLAIIDEASPSQPFTFIGTPLNGYLGEYAGLRFSRLLTEESIPVDAASAFTPTMGSQSADATLLTHLRECETAEHGIMSDHTGRVVLRELVTLWDQTPKLTIDGANRELFGPWQPLRDDQKRRNRSRATRPAGGASALVEDAGSIARHGVYDGDVTVNIDNDARLIDHASHAVTIGTVEGKRHPTLSVDLLRAPQFARAMLELDLGDVARVVNQPKQAAKGDFDLMVRGVLHTWEGRMKWRAELNCVSAEPYRAWRVAAAGNAGRLDDLPTAHTMAADAGPTATSLSVATAAGNQLITTSAAFPADFPFDLNIDGEQVRVTAVVGAASPQTLTAVRSINGVRKVLRTGRPLTLWRPSRLVMESVA